ncbi:MAG: ABC transporter ATP-binding protein [Ignavibacteriales bacterium]
MSEILKCSCVNKSFVTAENEKLHILKDVSLSVNENKVTVIIGASGAGKSTFLHILGGLDKPDAGEVILFGQDLYKLKNDELANFRNKNIGFVFQFHHLLPEFSAEENVMIPLLISGKNKSEARKRSRELLEIVGLEKRRTHKPAELSGGESQRVAVARALACNPKIIFADEPTGNLDSVNSQILNQLFLDLKNELKINFLIVTHNPELMKIGDEIIEMKDGKIISQI